MVLRLPDAWLWDFWLVQQGDSYHLFFLFASRALQDEQRRHRRAAIGHAVSEDLRSWVQVGDVLASSDPPAFDDLATWTGSIVQGPDGRSTDLAVDVGGLHFFDADTGHAIGHPDTTSTNGSRSTAARSV